MAKSNINIQDGYLFHSLKSDRELSVQLVTGSTISGKLKRFDRFALILESAGHEVMIYKHGIVSVALPPADETS